MRGGRTAKPIPQPYQVGKIRHILEPVKEETDSLVISLPHGGSDGINKLVSVHKHAGSLDW
ncbi:hypothetical protein ABZ934_31425 [Streptomyces sp. NPDC046557]|uniref:hypothetical protein n=1 Tax=Streptomyces sp. NPDC046557 TaxID=3155372 RepID=UPI0033EAF8D3